MLGGETPPNICRQKHGRTKTKKESSIKKSKHENQNMKINFWNHEFFTTYTTHAICFLEGDQATDQATAEAKAKAQATDQCRCQGPGYGPCQREGCHCHKNRHNVFRQFHSPTFLMMCQDSSLVPSP